MKKVICISVITGILAIGSAQLLFAAEKGAGCGIGKVILDGRTGQDPHIVAAILNDILIPRTIFMSTATSMNKPMLGCDPKQTVQREQEKTVFVASNIDQLSQEMAQGGGVHLEALADAIGVQDQDKPAFYAMTQNELPKLISAQEQGTGEVLTSLRLAMAERPILAQYVQ